MIEYFIDTITQNVTWLEVAWTLPAILGMIRYGFIRYRHTYESRKIYKAEHGENSIYYAYNIRAFRFLIIAIIFECFSLIGMRAMVTPNVPTSSTSTELDQLLVVLLLLSGEMALFLKGEYVDRLENKAYRKRLEEENERERERRDDVHGMMMHKCPRYAETDGNCY
jgi:hypothetical protein